MSVGGSYVFASTGEYAQDPAVHYGKLLRLNEDGTPPGDNPFVSSGEHLPEVYSVGHRNQLGLAFHPGTGELWASENGPQGGDEANIIHPGKNYGWQLHPIAASTEGTGSPRRPGGPSSRVRRSYGGRPLPRPDSRSTAGSTFPSGRATCLSVP